MQWLLILIVEDFCYLDTLLVLGSLWYMVFKCEFFSILTLTSTEKDKSWNFILGSVLEALVFLLLWLFF